VGKPCRGVVEYFTDMGSAHVIVEGLSEVAGVLRPREMNRLAKENMAPGKELDALWISGFEKNGEVVLLSMHPPKRKPETMKPGAQVTGIVMDILAGDKGLHGAFVDVGVERDGLLLATEMSAGLVKKASDFVKLGQKVDLWVKDTRDDGRFVLTMIKPRLPIYKLGHGHKLTGIVKRRMNSEAGGYFIDVGYEKDGWLRASEIPQDRDFMVGEEVKVYVHDVRREQGDFLLALKRPPPTLASLQVGVSIVARVVDLRDKWILVDVGCNVPVPIFEAELEKYGEPMTSDQYWLTEEVVVWVTAKNPDGSVYLTTRAPKVDVRTFSPGDAVEGHLAWWTDREAKTIAAFVDIGAPALSLLKREDLPEARRRGGRQELVVNETVQFYIKGQALDGKLVLSLDPKAHFQVEPQIEESAFGDWRCPGCSGKNQKREQRCFKCGLDKPKTAAGAARAAAKRARRQEIRDLSGGDPGAWTDQRVYSDRGNLDDDRGQGGRGLREEVRGQGGQEGRSRWNDDGEQGGRGRRNDDRGQVVRGNDDRGQGGRGRRDDERGEAGRGGRRQEGVAERPRAGRGPEKGAVGGARPSRGQDADGADRSRPPARGRREAEVQADEDSFAGGKGRWE